ncbi:hypothetical protein [Pantoea ananatis]|uniref:hypothetical protein n=1 Tax=Pantoea ananas TaxID=553 RepID=UPI001B304A31|nr:hypothetical protein [Pantoea ananatis]
MTRQNPELNLNYSELLSTTEFLLQDSLSLPENDIPDSADRALRRGIILHWYHLALRSGAPEAQCRADMAKLCDLAGMPGDSEETASVE